MLIRTLEEKNGSLNLKTHLNLLAAEYSTQAFHTARMEEGEWESKSSGCMHSMATRENIRILLIL